MASDSSELERLYKTESDPEVKERLFLVMKVQGDGMVPSQVAKDLHRSRTGASDWMARYRDEGVSQMRSKLHRLQALSVLVRAQTKR